MGRRSRAGGRAARPRAAERDAIARGQLTPLAPGERPAALVVAAGVSLALAVANLALLVAGVEVEGTDPGPGGVLLFVGLMLLMAWGMWTARYWAVLGFQALLATSAVIAALSLLVASNLAALALCLGVLGLGGWLFWKLVRVLGRMKVPRPGS
ncbi:MAG: hypothetical protein LT070_11385 [Solirubrobacteraceae bacterium]|nr:hypothetical protein [Solirubrobacteraceae bacterium]